MKKGGGKGRKGDGKEGGKGKWVREECGREKAVRKGQTGGKEGKIDGNVSEMKMV